MSGEIVVASSLFHAAAAAAPLLGAIVVGSLVYQAVKAHQEQARLEAAQAARRRMRELQQWRAFQEVQQARMQAEAGHWQALQEQLQALSVTDPPGAPAQAAERPHATGFLQQARAVEEQRLRLQGLADLLAAVPPELDEHSAGVFDRLAEEVGRLQQQMEQGPPPLASALDTFQALVEESIDAARQRLAQQPQRQADRLAELEALLERLSQLGGMAQGEDSNRIEDLEGRLLAALETGSISAVQTQGFRDELQRLATRVETERDNRLVRQQLQERVRVHLETMGYRRLEQDARGSLWGIPGGEQVRIAAQPDLRLAFQLQHERFSASQAPLDGAELGLLRQQERRWCGDLKTLMQRLNADGFRFQVEFERQIPEESVPVVMVQDVEEILRRQANSEPLRRRETE